MSQEYEERLARPMRRTCMECGTMLHGELEMNERGRCAPCWAEHEMDEHMSQESEFWPSHYPDTATHYRPYHFWIAPSWAGVQDAVSHIER